MIVRNGEYFAPLFRDCTPPEQRFLLLRASRCGSQVLMISLLFSICVIMLAGKLRQRSR